MFGGEIKLAESDGQIILSLNISATTSNIKAELDSILDNLKPKEIVLRAKIEDINFGNAAAQIRNVTSQINSTFSNALEQSFVKGSKAASNFEASVKRAQNAINNNAISASLTKVNAEYEKLGSTGHEKLTQIQTDLQLLNQLQQTMITTTDNKKLVSSYEEYQQVLQRVKNNLSIVSTEVKKANSEMATMAKSQTLSNNIETWMNRNAKAAQVYGEKLRELQSTLSNNKDSNVLSQASVEFSKIQSEAKAAGLVTNQFATSLKNVGLQVLGLSSAVMVIQKLISVIKEGVNTIVELDTALVDLKKTSTATPQELAKFYSEANDMAKQFGTTTKEIIQGTADWSRLGYNLNDSKIMAQMSSMFASISPGMSVEDATSGLVSVMKAFGIEADNVLDGVMSKINIVGNNFAVSNADVVEGLQRSASAMAAMGQDLDSTIALFTAANEVLQDSASTGTALRNMSLRIRGFDEETEQLSDDLVDITGKIVDYTKTAKNAQGVSIFTDASQEHYKDFVSYFKELSEVWDDMSEKNQTALLNDLFGKRGAQAGAALIQNFSTVEAALDKMANSAGNAEKEMEIITESLSYKLNALKETGTGIFQNLFQKEDIGTVIDALTSVMSVIDAITEKLGLFGTIAVGGGIFAFLKNLDRVSNHTHSYGLCGSNYTE